MKILNEQHDATIVFDRRPTTDKAKVGDVIEHAQQVDRVYFFEPLDCDHERHTYIKIGLSRKFILDLADQIRSIESEVVEQKVEEDLPF